MFRLSASAFAEGADIPVEHTCDAANISPALTWTEPPDGTRSLALVADDPDAPGRTWVHWVLYGLAPVPRELPEAIETALTLPSGGRQGSNDFGRIGYGGPCPPPGAPHRYFFRLYALDTILGLAPGATRAALDRAMRGHVLATAEVMGRYQRRPHR